MNGLQIAGTAIATGVGLLGGSYLLQSLYDRCYERVRQWQRDSDERRRSQITILRADQYGRHGIAFDGTTYRDLDTLATFEQRLNVALNPILEQLKWQHNMMIALSHAELPKTIHYENIVGDHLVAPGDDVGELETGDRLRLESLSLDALLAKHRFRPRLHNVLIGEYVDENNTARPLTLDIPKAVHILCTGASGLGKSTLLEAIALQLATVSDVSMCAVDYGSGTFDALESFMRWSIADTPDLAVALFKELIRLANERKELYKSVDRARSLDHFNAMSGERLPFIACFVDETSALLDHDGTKEAVITLARMGRKYGVGLLLGGTDFACSTLPSAARGNCQARIAFWLESGLSRSLLGSDVATRLSGDVGDIVCRLPGRGPAIVGHTPMVVEGDYSRLPQKSGKTDVLPVVVAAIEDDPSLPDAERVYRLHDAGKTVTAIARTVFKYGNAHYIQKVRDILANRDVVVVVDDAHNEGNNNGHDNNDNHDNRMGDEIQGATQGEN